MPIDINFLILVTLAAWHYAIRCGFISDDHAVLEQRLDIIPDEEKRPKKESYWLKAFNDGIVTFFINEVMTKLRLRKSPFAWHVLTLSLHIGNVVLLYKLLSSLLGEPVAMVSVLLWSINPMLNQVVVWISGRPYSTAMLLCLVAMLNWQNPLIVIPLYMLAVMTNISIAFVPVLLKIIHPQDWQTTLYVVIMFVVGFPYIGWKFYKRFTQALVIDRENFRWKNRRIFTLLRLYGYYIWTLCVPIRMGWYHQVGFRYNKKWERFNFWTLISTIVVAFILKHDIAAWWFLLGLFPNMNINASNSFVQDRYVYFGSVGLAIIAAHYFTPYPIVVFCLVTFYATRSYMYSRQMIDDEAMYRENWRNHPRSDYAVNNLSYFLIQQHRYDEARVMIMRAIEVSKDNKMLWYNLGITYAAQGNLNNDEGKFRFLKALDCWKVCLQLEPRWSKPAEDMKKLVKLLVDNKVLTLDQTQSAMKGSPIDLPNLIGLGKET